MVVSRGSLYKHEDNEGNKVIFNNPMGNPNEQSYTQHIHNRQYRTLNRNRTEHIYTGDNDSD